MTSLLFTINWEALSYYLSSVITVPVNLLPLYTPGRDVLRDRKSLKLELVSNNTATHFVALCNLSSVLEKNYLTLKDYIHKCTLITISANQIWGSCCSSHFLVVEMESKIN